MLIQTTNLLGVPARQVFTRFSHLAFAWAPCLAVQTPQKHRDLRYCLHKRLHGARGSHLVFLDPLLAARVGFWDTLSLSDFVTHFGFCTSFFQAVPFGFGTRTEPRSKRIGFKDNKWYFKFTFKKNTSASWENELPCLSVTSLWAIGGEGEHGNVQCLALATPQTSISTFYNQFWPCDLCGKINWDI